MKHLGRVAALAGLLVSLWLVWQSNPGAVLGALRAAGAGLVLAALAHVLPMLANACDWRSLIRGANRPGIGRMLHLVWVRESVNSMLPVARIGGEVVSFRMLRRWGVRPSTAVGSIVVDMQLTVISQLLFTMVGIGFLFAHAQSDTLRLAGQLAWGVVVLTPLLVLFALVQHASPFERITRMLNRMTSGKLAALVGQSAQIDQAIKLIWRRRAVVLRYLFFWQPLQCFLTVAGNLARAVFSRRARHARRSGGDRIADPGDQQRGVLRAGRSGRAGGRLHSDWRRARLSIRPPVSRWRARGAFAIC